MALVTRRRPVDGSGEGAHLDQEIRSLSSVPSGPCIEKPHSPPTWNSEDRSGRQGQRSPPKKSTLSPVSSAPVCSVWGSQREDVESVAPSQRARSEALVVSRRTYACSVTSFFGVLPAWNRSAAAQRRYPCHFA